MKKILIVGINSYVGSNLGKYLKIKKYKIYGTTKEKIIKKKKIFYFDLKKPNFDNLDIKFDDAIICASITSVKKCEKNPNITRKVNVNNTVKLLKYLSSKSIFTIFISSNLVFDGKKPFNKVNEKTNPISEYGKQKLLVEKFIKTKNYNNFSIIRFTKVIGENSKFIKNLKIKILKKRRFIYSGEYFISPINISKVCKIILKVIKNKNKGIFQAGGKKEYNLKEFIEKFLKSKNILFKSLKYKKNNRINRHNSLDTFLPFKI